MLCEEFTNNEGSELKDLTQLPLKHECNHEELIYKTMENSDCMIVNFANSVASCRRGSLTVFRHLAFLVPFEEQESDQ